MPVLSVLITVTIGLILVKLYASDTIKKPLTEKQLDLDYDNSSDSDDDN